MISSRSVSNRTYLLVNTPRCLLCPYHSTETRVSTSNLHSHGCFLLEPRRQQRICERCANNTSTWEWVWEWGEWSIFTSVFMYFRLHTVSVDCEAKRSITNMFSVDSISCQRWHIFIWRENKIFNMTWCLILCCWQVVNRAGCIFFSAYKSASVGCSKIDP